MDVKYIFHFNMNIESVYSKSTLVTRSVSGKIVTMAKSARHALPSLSHIPRRCHVRCPSLRTGKVVA